MIRVAVSGAAGRMGRMAAETVAAADDMQLVAAHAPGHTGENIAGVAIVESLDGVECDVAVDWTDPSAVLGNLETYARSGYHAVIGTSGFDAAKLDAARTAWEEASGNCMIIPNFSIGAVLMMQFAERAAPHFGGVEVIEAHHDDKPDHPSGTALATAARIAAAGGSNLASIEGRGTDVSGVPVHSIRIPGVIASQEVVFGGTGETLTIRHDTFDRQAFMPGMLLAIRAVADLPASFTVGLDSLLVG